VEAGAKLSDSKVVEGIVEMEFDEVAVFVGCKK